MSRKEMLEYAEELGLHSATYSPGDGVTRYRFFRDAGNSYFGPGSGIYTALGLSEASTWLAGYACGLGAGAEAWN